MRILTKAAIGMAIMLLAVVGAWVFSPAARPPVELMFVRYDYDTIVLRATNRTSVRVLLLAHGPPNITFNESQYFLGPHDGCDIFTTWRKIDPSSLPSQIDFPCVSLSSDHRRRVTAFLQKIGIHMGITNQFVSVKLPPVDPVPMRP